MRKQTFFLLLVSMAVLSSCVSNKKILQRSLYFRDITDSLLRQPASFEQSFQPGDILYIGVITPNEKSSVILNQPNFMAGNGAGSAGDGGGPLGYLVENDGKITFPWLGRVQAAGLNKTQLIQDLTNRLSPSLDSVIVSVRLLNYKVTVLGEVNAPGTYNIPNERVTILDALGLAGDLTLYGERDSIRVVRRIEDKVETGTVNLNTGDVFNSPYYYLQQNDIVYVKMNKRKIAASDQTTLRNISLGLGILSTLTIIFTRIK